ncbi:putative oxidoreductase CzcO [Hartmannibacter diazotrophicus]|uniref:Putative oxidoreductase CzcO n=1 Tax=Hartmannibacter diazotrophicus TaxID=1482074 RepID=A0A2C9DA98_9HYPH|nr:MSMEG_0569 family flavin-dependent oxidoreductase [Hartmannibacter diazotrophicus]SON57109.1 putative oxidoreductase CzcO [Hartmannibacter diazotrophicus]
MNSPMKIEHFPVVVIGAGQAGLSVSWFLKKAGIRHVVLEKNQAFHAWKTERWDSFSLVTPNWQCQLPGHPYDGPDPYGFMVRDEIVDYLDAYVEKLQPPLREGVAVKKLSGNAFSGFVLDTTSGMMTADQVVIAAGGYQIPIVPREAERLPTDLVQVHSSIYRNPEQLPEGAVLVVGSGQSGAQIAEDLHLAGRKVHLCLGDAPRVARRYRGKDVVEWLADMGYYDLPVHAHPLREGVRDKTNHYVTGRDGGRDIDLRQRALEGMELYGQFVDAREGKVKVADTVKECLDSADATNESIKDSIDAFIAKAGIDAPAEDRKPPVWEPSGRPTEIDLQGESIASIVWCIGFRTDYSWIDLPVFNGRGHPSHDRGVTSMPGAYFLGLPWLHTWGSGRFSGVARDAEHVAGQIIARHVDVIGMSERVNEAAIGS